MRVIIITALPICALGSGKRIDSFEILFFIQACNIALYLITAPLHRRAQHIARPFFIYHLVTMIVFAFSLAHLVIMYVFGPVSSYYTVFAFYGTWLAMFLMYWWALLSTVTRCIRLPEGIGAPAVLGSFRNQPSEEYEDGAGI